MYKVSVYRVWEDNISCSWQVREWFSNFSLPIGPHTINGNIEWNVENLGLRETITIIVSNPCKARSFSRRIAANLSLFLVQLQANERGRIW